MTFFTKNKNKQFTKPKNISVSKKISFLSIILLTMGSSIGAGIFFKNGEVIGNASAGGVGTSTAITMAILSWLVVAISVIAMALALLEIVSAQKDDKGIVGWTKIFAHKIIYKSCKNFFVFLYLPINYFMMPYYALLSFQNALGFNWPWYIYMIVAFSISIWFLFMAGISSKLGNIQNWIITLVKFLPLIFAILIGYIIVSNPSSSGITPGGNLVTDSILPGISSLPANPFNDINPGLGLFLSIPAIFFAFDGFYAAAGVQSQVRNPKKTPLALGLGLAITSFIYIMVTISIIIVSNGSGTEFNPSTNIQSNGITQWFFENNTTWILVAINFFIGFGVLGIINGFAMYSPHLYEDLISDGEIPFTRRYIRKLNKDRPWVGIWVSLILTVPVFIVFSLIGALAYFNSSGYSSQLNLVALLSFNGTWADVLQTDALNIAYSSEVRNLFSMVDLTANWTSLFAFAYIGFAIIGALRNRKTKKIQVKKVKFFLTFAWIAAILVNLGMTFLFIGAFANLIMVAVNFEAYILDPTWGEAAAKELLNGQIAKFIVLFLFIALSFLPIIWDYYSDKKTKIKMKEEKINFLQNDKYIMEKFWKKYN